MREVKMSSLNHDERRLSAGGVLPAFVGFFFHKKVESLSNLRKRHSIYWHTLDHIPFIFLDIFLFFS